MVVKVKFNPNQLEAGIRQVGDKALANGARSLRRIAERIVRNAKRFAPVDDGDLENCIEMEEIKNNQTRRLEFVVFVNGDRPAKSDDEGNTTKVVGDYALLIEQGMAPYGSGRYHLGPKSREKADGGEPVGGRFMRRAFDIAVEQAAKDIPDAVKAAIGGGNRIVPLQNPIMKRSDYGGDE